MLSGEVFQEDNASGDFDGGGAFLQSFAFGGGGSFYSGAYWVENRVCYFFCGVCGNYGGF